MAGDSSTMGLINPYLEFYRAMPAACRRDPSVPVSAAELLSPQWLNLKAAIAGHFAWAVPTEEAVRTIQKYSARVVEIGAGSGYWAWMMRQAGIKVVAFDTNHAPFHLGRGRSRRRASSAFLPGSRVISVLAALEQRYGLQCRHLPSG